MTNVAYMNDYRPGVKLYTPEMGERKPNTRMEARLGHYGKHYFIDTTEILNGRGIEYLKTYTKNDFNEDGYYKIGWYSYKVTERAFKYLETKYPISMKMYLD